MINNKRNYVEQSNSDKNRILNESRNADKNKLIEDKYQRWKSTYNKNDLIPNEYKDRYLNESNRYDNSIKTNLTEAMQLPLRYMVEPDKFIGDAVSTVAPGSKLSKYLNNTGNDRLQHREMINNPNISTGQKMGRSWTEGAGLANQALIGELGGAAVMKGVGYVAPKIATQIKRTVTNYNDSKLLNNFASEYGYKTKLNPYLSRSKKIDKTYKNLLDQHNTYARGVSTNWDKVTPEVLTALDKAGINYKSNPKAAAEYMATHIPGETGYGRVGTDHLLNDDIGSIYTSNSLGTAEGYTYGDGYVVKVKNPTNYSAQSRSDWIKSNNSEHYINDVNKSNLKPGIIIKTEYNKFLDRPLESNADMQTFFSTNKFNNKKLKHDTAYKLSNELDDLSNKSKLQFNIDNEVNNKRRKELLDKYANNIETDAESEELDYLNKVYHKNVNDRKANLRESQILHLKNTVGLPEINPYAHYIKLDRPGNKVFDVVDSYQINPENYVNKSRAHSGEYSSGLTRRKYGGELKISKEFITKFGGIGEQIDIVLKMKEDK